MFLLILAMSSFLYSCDPNSREDRRGGKWPGSPFADSALLKHHPCSVGSCWCLERAALLDCFGQATKKNRAVLNLEGESPTITGAWFVTTNREKLRGWGFLLLFIGFSERCQKSFFVVAVVRLRLVSAQLFPLLSAGLLSSKRIPDSCLLLLVGKL